MVLFGEAAVRVSLLFLFFLSSLLVRQHKRVMLTLSTKLSTNYLESLYGLCTKFEWKMLDRRWCPQTIPT